MAEENKHDQDFLYKLRHSTSHVMAQAVLEMFPAGKIAIGPPIDNGFYYDFDLPRPLTPEDLAQIEKRMKEIIRGNHPFIRREISPEEARALHIGIVSRHPGRGNLRIWEPRGRRGNAFYLQA